MVDMAVVTQIRAQLRRKDGRAHNALRALRALGAGGRGASAVDGASAVALATYATRTLALDLATFGDDDAERSVAAKGVHAAISASLDQVATRVDDSTWVTGLTTNKSLGEACALVAEVCEGDGSSQRALARSVRGAWQGVTGCAMKRSWKYNKKSAGAVKRAHAAACAQCPTITRSIKPPRRGVAA